jgi:hypothetical protein
MYNINVSNGELIDKYTILCIKQIKINDVNKLEFITKEKNELQRFILELKDRNNIDNLILELQNVNLKLWSIEDNLREKEKNKLFDQEFIDLARSVYINNDKRAEIKLEINKITNCKIREVKSYQNY